MKQLLNTLKREYPDIAFKDGDICSWSPVNQTITYKIGTQSKCQWALLHELAHALLEHRKYETDFELLLLEVAAWDKAKLLAKDYKITIDEDHIQDCIDTYRDWLYQRSCCPTCTNTSLQQDSVTYKCFNCNASWTVSSSRFCRPYRLSSKQQKTPSAALTGSGTTFL